MADDFTTYWTPDGWKALEIGAPVTFAASNLFKARGVKRGSRLYIVNIAKGAVSLLGRFRVADIVGHREAERRTGVRVWDASEVALADESSASTLAVRDVPTHLLKDIRFDSPDGPKGLAFRASGGVDGQTLRGVRKLSSESVRLFESLLRIDDGSEAGKPALENASRITAEQYADAFSAVDASMTPQQREMLVGHANAPEQTLSMERIAELAGYGTYSAANAQYGKLGAMVATELRISGLDNQVQAICESAGVADASGHFQWTLRKPVVAALIELGIVDGPALSDNDQAAADSFSQDPELAGETPTSRKALVDARIGQGAYRKRMLRWWGNRCAVTGCSVASVLVASHAKAWKNSTNRERLDHFNGLPLIATLDRLFDCGLISFSATGNMLVSSNLVQPAREVLGIAKALKLRRVDPRHASYLAAHRSTYGFA